MAKEGADIGRHKAREGKGVLQPFLLRDLADVVAVIQRWHAGVPEIHHRRDMGPHRGAGGLFHCLGIGFLFRAPLGHVPALRQITVQRVMGRCLVGDDVGAVTTRLHATNKLGEDIGGIAQETDRLGFSLGGPVVDDRKCFIQSLGFGIQVSGANSKIDACLVAFDRKAAGPSHHSGQRLCATHTAKPAGQDPLTGEIAAIVLAARFGKCLIGALHDALGADVDPRPRGHLAIHGQPLLIEFVEMIPRRPMRHEVGVGDQHARGIFMGAEHANRFAGLHQQSFIVVQRFQRGDDLVKILPCPRRPTDAAVNHQFMRVFRHIRVQVVHQHPHRGLGQPAFRGDLGAGGGIDVAGVVTGVHGNLGAGGRQTASCGMGVAVAVTRAPDPIRWAAAVRSSAI